MPRSDSIITQVAPLASTPASPIASSEEYPEGLHPSLMCGVALPSRPEDLTVEHIRAAFDPKDVEAFLRQLVQAVACVRSEDGSEGVNGGDVA